MKKGLAFVLSMVMLLMAFAPVLSSAAEADAVKVTASSLNPITITKKETLPEEYDFNGLLDLTGGTFDIERDYAQSCSISVKNVSETSVEYYLTVMNTYSDIYLNFVRSGSPEIPLVIAAGETQQIQLDIFTQNAEHAEYTLPVYAHVVEGESEFVDSMTTAFLNVPTVNLNVSFAKKSSDPHTLAQVFTVRNNGVAVSDFTLVADEALKDFVFFSPSFENYPLQTGETVEFTVSPDLYKMKTNNVTKLEGSLIAQSGGSQKSEPVVFDTKGKEITTTTLGEIVKIQMGDLLPELETNAIDNGSFIKPVEDNPIKGNQCTNAGKVATSTYIPPIGQETMVASADASEENSIRLFLTSRMYGGDYVNRAETNYDYYINGELVSRSHNSGLTEVSITELPTDKIKFGATNTIVRDYDTNPGSHFVTADTNIVVVYPESTPVSYIGSPETLHDYRPLPDFAVFSENIFCEDTTIIRGVETNISANIYNLGYNPGTINIEVSDGTNIIYSEENHRIAGFSGDIISFAWTPTSIENTITVKLINTTDGIPEKSEDNNVASRTFRTRQREVPIIDSITPDYVVKGENIVYTTVSRYNDVTKVEFYLDNQLYNGEVSESVYGRSKRYWINDAELEEGTHTVRAVVYYESDEGVEQFVESTKDLSVFAPDWNQYVFKIDNNLTNVKFFIFDTVHHSNRRVYNVVRNGDECTYSMTKAEHDAPEDYLIVVSSDDSLLFKSLADDGDLLKSSARTLTINSNSAMEVNSIYLRSVGEMDITSTFYNQNILSLSPGNYEFDVSLFYLGEYRSVRVQADLTENDQTINLEDYFAQFDFDFEDGVQGTPSANVYIFDSNNVKQTIQPMIQVEGNRLLVVLSASDQTLYNAAVRALVCVSTDDILYVLDAKTNPNTVSIKKDILQKYNLSAGEFTVTEVEIACEDFVETLHASTIYITPGEYDITAYCKDLGDKTLITGAFSGIRYAPQKIEAAENSIAVNASFAFDRYLSLYAIGSAGDIISNDHYFSGDRISAKPDTYQTNLNLNRNTASFTVTTQMNTATGKDLAIGNEFIGTIANSFGSYEGYSEITLYLSDVKDTYQNRLTAFNAKNASDNLSGELIFTNTEDESDRHSVWVSMSNMAALSVILPDLDGTYDLQLVLSNGSEVDTLKGISMTITDLVMFCNRSYTMDVVAHPADYQMPKLIWSSSDESVATVDENGVITSAYEDTGTAIITAQTEDGSYIAQCKVTVRYHLGQWIRKIAVTIYRAVKQLVVSLLEKCKSVF